MKVLPHQFPVFNGVQEMDALMVALDQLPIRKFPQGMTIFVEGEDSEEVYGVLSGEVEILKKGEDGSLVPLATIQPGGILGEMSHLTGARRQAAAVVKERASLLEISPTWLKRHVHRFPEIQAYLEGVYKERVLANLLAKSTFFGSLDTSEIHRLAQGLNIEKYGAEDEVFLAGSPGGDLYIVKKGDVSVRVASGSEQIEVQKLSPGAILGEMSLLTGAPRSASVIAISDVEMVRLPKSLILQTLESHPSILKAMEGVIRYRSDQNRQALESLVGEIVGDAWEEDEELPGISVEQLGIKVELSSTEGTQVGELENISKHRWRVKMPNVTDDFVIAKTYEAKLVKRSLKGLNVFFQDKGFKVSLGAIKGNTLTCLLADGELLEAKSQDLLTLLAKERVRLFVYPEYDLSAHKIPVYIKKQGRPSVEGQIETLSETHVKVRAPLSFDQADWAQLKFDASSAALNALCLDAYDGKVEFQFEYETSMERTSIQSLVRKFSRAQGFGYGGAGATPEVTEPSGGRQDLLELPVIKESVATKRELLRKMMSIIDTGQYHFTRRQTYIPTQKLRFEFSANDSGDASIKAVGVVKASTNHVHDIDFGQDVETIRFRLAQFCQTMVESRTKDSWQNQKNRLLSDAKQASGRDRSGARRKGPGRKKSKKNYADVNAHFRARNVFWVAFVACVSLAALIWFSLVR